MFMGPVGSSFTSIGTFRLGSGLLERNNIPFREPPLTNQGCISSQASLVIFTIFEPFMVNSYRSVWLFLMAENTIFVSSSIKVISSTRSNLLGGMRYSSILAFREL